MKPFYKSLTFWSLVVTLIGLVLAGVGQGRPLLELLSDVEVQATLGEVLTALGIGGALVGRARAQGPLTRGNGDESGRVDIGLILAVAGLAVIAVGWTVASGGCGTSGDVRPQLAIDESTDLAVGGAVSTGQSSQAHPSGMLTADFSDCILGPRGCGIALASQIGSARQSVRGIRHLCAPSEVGGAVVESVAVIVAALHPIRARADEGHEHQPANLATPAAQNDDVVPSRRDLRPQASPVIADDGFGPPTATQANLLHARPHAAIVADAVAGEPWHVSVNHCRLVNSHRRRLQTGGDWLGQSGATNARLSALNLSGGRS